MNPTPDIDIGELRRLEQAADAALNPRDEIMVMVAFAERDYWTALRNAAPALLAKWEAADGAYRERDMLVAALSKCFPSYLSRHSDDDKTWEDDWRWIVYIELPTGQASWHIHDSEREMFNHLEVRENNWDGHNTERKYQRLAALKSMPEMCVAHIAVAALKSRLAAAEAVVSAARKCVRPTVTFADGKALIPSDDVWSLVHALSTYEGKSE